MRVLELGGGSGQVACVLAKYWHCTVVTLEPWHGGETIQELAEREGVWERVIPLRIDVHSAPLPRESFDAAIAFGTLEMIGADRPVALEAVRRMLRPGARFGIGEPMSLPVPDPSHEFDTLEVSVELFKHHGFEIAQAEYFEHGWQ